MLLLSIKYILIAILARFSIVCAEEDRCTENEISGTAKKSSKQIYADLRQNLALIRESCGEVCDTTKTGVPDKYYDFIEKEVNCKALFENDLIDRPSELPRPPKKIPKYLLDDYTYNGRLELKSWYLDDTQGSGSDFSPWEDWTMEYMEKHFQVKQRVSAYF